MGSRVQDPRSEVVARDVMRTDVRLLDAGTLLGAAWERMREQDVEHVVVVQDGVCLGLLTLDAVATAWSLELMPRSHRTVLALVTPTTCVDERTTSDQLHGLLLRDRQRAALVTDEAGTLLGVVTYDDLRAKLAAPVEPTG